MIIEQELRQQIQCVVSGVMSLNQLYEWLMDRSWNMHKDSAPSAVELAAEVEELFYERSEGHIQDNVVVVRLASLITQPGASTP